MVKFESLSISESVLAALVEMGFTEATPIQQAMIPIARAGRDAIGQAQTGTGKTAAFGIPLIEAALEGRVSLVLVPTRELAQQVAAEIDRLGKHAGVSALAVYGGASFGEQARTIERGNASILVATPGRLRDHLSRGTLDASAASIIVLDEADEMLNMGFVEEVEAILESLPATRQTLLFSATMPEPIVRLSERFLANPEFVSIVGEKDSIAADNTKQFVVQVRHAEKADALARILAVERPTGTLVFRHTRETVDELVVTLRSKGIAAEALHGGMAQPVRDGVLARFRDERVKVLVATNVAARGLDVDTLSHVVNYDAPREAEAYVHRIGRTGRAGREGRSFLFVTPADRGRLRGIERELGSRLETYRVPMDADVLAASDAHVARWLEAKAGEQDLDRALAIVDAAIERGLDVRRIAAAALKAAAKHEGLEAPPLERQSPPAHFQEPRSARERSDRPRAGASDGDRVAISFSVGRDDGVRPGDLVGALANEGGLAGSDVGRIDILPRMSVAEIPADRVEEVLNAMASTTIRSRPTRMRVAEGWQFRPARRPMASRN